MDAFIVDVLDSEIAFRREGLDPPVEAVGTGLGDDPRSCLINVQRSARAVRLTDQNPRTGLGSGEKRRLANGGADSVRPGREVQDLELDPTGAIEILAKQRCSVRQDGDIEESRIIAGRHIGIAGRLTGAGIDLVDGDVHLAAPLVACNGSWLTLDDHQEASVG